MRAVVDSLYTYLIDALPPGRAYSPERFERPPVPSQISQYLRGALEARLDGALAALEAGGTTWYDAGDPEVRQARAAFREAARRHARIPADAWPDALRSAVEEVVAYLARPAATLTRHIYDDASGPLAPQEVLRRMASFEAYGYLHEVVAAYFDQKDVDVIDRQRFGSLVRRIDRKMVADHGADEWLRVLAPVFELMEAVPAAAGEVPVSMLRAFFAEKEAHAIEQRLAEREDRHGVDRIDREGLRRILEAPAGERKEEAPDRRPSPGARPAREEEGAVPLWKKYQQGFTPAPTPPSRPEPPARTGSPAPASSDDNVPLWKKFQAPDAESPEGKASAGERRERARGEETPRPASGAAADLERAVLGERGPRNRELFVKHLFSGSREDYEATLRKLHDAPSWTQASQIIAQEVFLKHQVNIYSEPAVAFTDAVEAQFRE